MKASRKVSIAFGATALIAASVGVLSACSSNSSANIKYKTTSSTAMLTPDVLTSKNAPIASYWFPNQFLKWSASKDKDLDYNKSTVPLAKRIVSSKLTPTNATQNKDTKIVALSNMNSSTSGNPSRGTNSINAYPFDYWQYVDTLVYWGGSAGEGTIVPPSADVIDDAHTNGVPVLGTIFCPPTVYGGKTSWVETMIKQDKNGDFPFAKQMVAVAKAYGFDGWFINQETEGLNSSQATKMKELVAAAKALDPQLDIMWYDAMTKDGKVGWQNQLNSENAEFIDDNGQKIADSMFLNFDWNQAKSTPNLVKNSADYAKKIGVNPYDIYAGIDVGDGGGVSTQVNWPLIESGKNSTYTSIGLYSPSATYSNASDFDDFQTQESTFWVNSQGDPREVGTSTNYSWIGLSKYVIEKSVIQGEDFSTNFNIGVGYNWFKDGQKVSAQQWSNRSLAEVMPTYRWIIDNEGNNKLTPSIDLANAYNGGSSLKFMANMDAGKASTVTLFASQLKANKNTEFSVAMRSDDKLNVSAVVELSDGSSKTIKGNTAATNKWGLIKFDTKGLIGKTITKIGLKFEADKALAGNAINLGALNFTDNLTSKKLSISDVKAESKVFEQEGTVAGVRLSWNGTTNKDLQNYEVYQVNSDGTRSFIGASNINNYFVDALVRGKNVKSTKFEVVPVNKQGEVGAGATTSITWPDNSLPKANFTADQTVVAPGATVTFINQSNLPSTKFKWTFEGADKTTSTAKNPKVTYAKAGTYKVTLEAINSKGKTDTKTKTGFITVTDAAKAGLENYALKAKTTVDSFTNDNEWGPNAVDGNVKTKWCAVGTTQHNIVIDLGSTRKINEVVIDHAEAGGESPDMNTKAYTVQVSTDNKNWTEVVNVTNNTAAETKDSFAQIDARYVKLTAVKPTQGSDNAVRWYEIQVLGLKN
ncbi:MAG: discoidin domain-containing protein [Streptococcaceae bacterium]|nr:discoidin domain-containing protein [Streptococcaceae bacterium]